MRLALKGLRVSLFLLVGPVGLVGLVMLVMPLAACSRSTPADEHDVAPVPADSPIAPVPADSLIAPVPADSPIAPVLADSPTTPVPADSPARASIYDEPVPELAETRLLCDALHLLPARRRAECCPGPPADSHAQAAADTCAADLSAAVAGGGVVLDDERLTSCIAAREQQLAGCAWVGPSPPPRPVACAAAVHGTLTAQSRCRSHHECAPGLRCAGLGPLRPGLCAASTVDEGDLVDVRARHRREDIGLADAPPPGRCHSDAGCPGTCRSGPGGAGTCVARCDP